MTTEILTCTCKHDFQDVTYGLKKRVHNLGIKGWRCTICGHLKELKALVKETK